MGTLFSILIGIFLYLYPLTNATLENTGLFAVIILAISLLIAAIQTAIPLFAWTPIHKAEQNLTPRVMKAFESDPNLRLTNGFLLLFQFFTYFVLLNTLFLKFFDVQYLFIGWTLLLGIAVDILHHDLRRVMFFLDPFYVVEHFDEKALQCVRDSKDEELLDWVDTLSETALKAINKHSPSLALLAVDKLRGVAKTYLEVAKGITYHGDEDTGSSATGDHVSYTLFYLFQRLEMVFDKSLKSELEPVCSKIVTSLGKISLYGAKYDITLTGYPLHFLAKFTKKAQKKDLQDVGNRASLTLLEVSKAIVKEVDLTYTDIKEAFATVITTMNQIAKDTFRSDKTINIQLLIQPLHELRALFQSPKIAEHPDTTYILNHIDSVLAEFADLEMVMSTIPPIPEIFKEREEQQAEEEKEKGEKEKEEEEE